MIGDEPIRPCSDRFVLFSQSHGENAHHPEREERRVPHQEEKLLFPDRGYGAVGQGDDGRTARTVVNEGHLAKNAVLAQSLGDGCRS